MTPEEKRIKLAELRGWKFDPETCADFPWLDPHGLSCVSPPYYFHDLDAMNKLESSLTKEQRAAYAENLTHAIRDQETRGFYHERFILVHLSAADRAEAFGKTLNLW